MKAVAAPSLEAGFAWWLAAFSAAGGVYEGYCIGLVSGLMNNAWPTFQQHFPGVQHTADSSNAFTFIFLFAAAIAALPPCAARVADRVGRKHGLLLFSYLAVIGGALMAAASAQVALDIGWALSGVACGGLSVIVPLYQSELAPARLRGKLLSTFQMALTLGIVSAILAVTFLETLEHLPELGWRLALGLQVVPAVILVLGIPFIPESPRWDMLNGREAAAKRSLIRIRKSNALDVLQELHEMKTYARHHGLVAAVADNDARHHALRRSAGRIGGAEASTVAPDVEAPTKLSNICACGLGSEGGALSSDEQRGVVVAVLLFVFQQLSGINALIYYAPEILQDGPLKSMAGESPGGHSTFSVQRLAVLITMGVNCLFSFVPVFLIDRMGRRAILCGGALGMSVTMGALALLSCDSDVWSDHDGVQQSVARLAFGVLMLIFVAGFAASWGVVAWVSMSELIPLRWHANGTSLAVCALWSSNAFVAWIAAQTPMSKLKWLFALFALFCLTAAAFVYACVPETSGVSLENAGSVFASDRDVEPEVVPGRASHDEERGASASSTSNGTGSQQPAAGTALEAALLPADDNDTLDKHEERPLAAAGYSQSLLAVLVSFDVWLSILWLFVIILLTSALFDVLLPPQGKTGSGAQQQPQLFYTVFCAAVWGSSCLVSVALLAMFFLREWALVLFLWKLFQLVSLLLTLISFVVADFLPATPNLSNIVSFIMATSSIYALYTSLLVRQLWRMPRIRDHYRQLPTRPERPVDTIGFLAYGSFSFRRQDLIGAGGMARVYKGMYAGTMVAVKEVAAGALTPSVCAEAALLSGLRHPAVLHMYGCCAHDAHLYIITELCDTSLHHELLKRSPHRLALEPALSLALQVAEGMQYLHSNGVAHRDLKPANILLSLDPVAGGITAKIGDFGLSRRTEDIMTAVTALVGTIQYMAPEMLTAAAAGQSEYSAAVDIYSFAIILWQLLTCGSPFERELEDYGRVGLLHRIAREGLRPEVPGWSPPQLSQLIKECWADAEHMRPTSTEVVRRLWQIHHTEFGAAPSRLPSGASEQSRLRVAPRRRESFPR